MPKKFVGENTKAAVAKERKVAKKEEDNLKKEKQKEEELWKDDDKLVTRKLQRKEQEEKKKQDQLRKKQELKDLLESEEKAIKPASKAAKSKPTRAEIQAELERNAAAQAAAAKKKEETHITAPLEENINRVEVDGLVARDITEAIAVLSTDESKEDLHPEKRLKAAFTAYEAENMPRIKEENPTLRLSQLKQILKKEWMKSPSNPLNQRN